MRQSQPESVGFLEHLESVTNDDVAGLKKVHKCYGNSWKLRGGVGVFMAFARKWDRIVIQVAAADGDIFRAVYKDQRSEGIWDDITDLRRYLLLLQSAMLIKDIADPESEKFLDNLEPTSEAVLKEALCEFDFRNVEWKASGVELFNTVKGLWERLENQAKNRFWDASKIDITLLRLFSAYLLLLESELKDCGFDGKHRDNTDK